MENEQAFEIEADIDATARLRPTSRASYQSLHKGQDIMNTAYGGYESQQQTHSEHSPLLARDAEQHGEVIDASGDDGPDSRRPPAWDGERDFEGRPWWNKPSVRENLLPGLDSGLTDREFRCFGFCHPSCSSPSLSVALSCPNWTSS